MTYYKPIEPAPVFVTPTRQPQVKPRSLAIQVALRMVLWACVNTLILTTVGYYFVSSRAEQRALAELTGYLSVRLRAEGQVFASAEANLSKFNERFLSLYTNPKVLPNVDLDAFFERKPDKTLRLRERFFSGAVDASGILRDGTTGFVAPQSAELTPEFKRRLILDYRLVSELGPAWNGLFANLYGALPENAGVVYWPNMPWALLLPAAAIGKRGRKFLTPTWSPLYFDSVAQRWNVSYERPVIHDGKPLLFIGQDILLDELMSRLISDHPVGAYNLILGKAGDLVAHPSRINTLKKSVEGPKVADLGDPILTSIYKAVHDDAKAHPGATGVRIIESPDANAYICYGELAGPGWWFVTVYPRELVLASAHEAANGLLLLGIVSFAIMTVIVLWVLRQRVGRPIGQMRVASERVSSGDYESVARGGVVLPIEQNNEIGVFARSFQIMAGKVGDATRNLEETVALRTSELQHANRELQRLSFKDALTGVGNRRCFDLDLESVVAAKGRGDSAMALLLCDVDHFKAYNDTYGHPAGDGALRMVAERIAAKVPLGRLYRYGGEEFAMLLPGRSAAECTRLAKAAIRSVGGLAIPHAGSPFGYVTISGGLTIIDAATSSPCAG